MRKSLVALALVAVSGVVFSEWFLNPKPVDEVERTEPDHLCKGCNVVLLSADSVRADRLPMYGYYRDTTPAILEFSKQAVVFQNYFAAGTLTPTSEAAVHTGRYPVTNGFSGFQTKMSLDSLTMAEVFKKSGYSTAAFMTSPEFFSRPNMKESFSRGYDHYYTQWRTSFHARDLKWSEYRKWLRKQRRTGKPFFTWVALGTAHWPFGTHAPRKFNNPRYRGILSRIDRIESSLLQHAVFQLIYDGYLYSRNGREIFIGRFDGTAGGSEPDPIEKKSIWPFEIPEGQKKVRLTAHDIQYVSDLYDNSIYAMDREFAQMLQILKELSLDKNTVVIFQSEHGEDMMEHGDYSHDNLWETTVKTPLIIKSPVVMNQSGSHVAEMVSGVDVAPSIYEHVGIDAKQLGASFDGVSFLRPDREKPFQPEREEVYLTQIPIWETLWGIQEKPEFLDALREANKTAHFRNYGIRTRTHKLIHRKARLVKSLYSLRNHFTGENRVEPEYEFYDLRRDPMEQFNLLNGKLSGEDRQVYESLLKKLQAFDKNMSENSRLVKATGEFQEYF